MAKLDNDKITENFAKLYEQYFDSFDVRLDGDDQPYIHAEYSHPRFKRTWIPVLFCGIPVHCAPTSSS
ncbi:MAG: hypothetical protein ACYTDT_04155 [Planctomycetota bacterium]